MTNDAILSNLIEADVFKVNGERIGTIDELLIDPYSGIIRSILLITTARKTIKLPWSAMCFDKSRKAFFLTPIGESVLKQSV